MVAAAGSGKTRTVIGLLEYRLRKGLEQAGRILLLSFSRKAVGELRERLPEDLRSAVEISTFHAFCLHHLKEAYPRALKDLKVLSDEKKEAFFYELLRQESYANQIGAIPIPLLYEQKEKFASYFPKLYKESERAYENYKRKERLFEFEDLIQMMLSSLRNKKNSSHRIAKIARAYDLIIVDEFQDTDPRQLEFLRLMKAERKLVVGDDWQAIYAFRGASLAPFLKFQKLFSAKVLSLCDNYRSLQEICNIGGRIIKASSKQIKKKVHAIRGAGPGLPVLSIELGAEEPPLLSEELARQGHQEYRLLVRTNWQRNFWIKMGFPEDHVITIHKSKGLEFPLVFLDLSAGWSRKNSKKSSSLSFWRGKNPLEWDEEIRILYVGASRAMNLLVILHYPEELAGERENFYCRKLLLARTRKCLIGDLSFWLEKESRFREKIA